jgi:hypothetical protein
MLVHWLSCIWYILIETDENWIPTKDLDFYETNFFTLGIWDQYGIIFHYMILLVVGNECAPVSFMQTLFASLVIILGSIVTAFIFGNMAALMANISKKDSYF